MAGGGWWLVADDWGDWWLVGLVVSGWGGWWLVISRCVLLGLLYSTFLAQEQQ